MNVSTHHRVIFIVWPALNSGLNRLSFGVFQALFGRFLFTPFCLRARVEIAVVWLCTAVVGKRELNRMETQEMGSDGRQDKSTASNRGYPIVRASFFCRLVLLVGGCFF